VPSWGFTDGWMEKPSYPSAVELTEKYTIHTCFQLSVFAFQYAIDRFLVLRKLLCVLNINYMAGNNSKKTTLEYITFLCIKKLTLKPWSSTPCSRRASLKSTEEIFEHSFFKAVFCNMCDKKCTKFHVILKIRCKLLCPKQAQKTSRLPTNAHQGSKKTNSI